MKTKTKRNYFTSKWRDAHTTECFSFALLRSLSQIDESWVLGDSRGTFPVNWEDQEGDEHRARSPLLSFSRLDVTSPDGGGISMLQSGVESSSDSRHVTHNEHNAIIFANKTDYISFQIDLWHTTRLTSRLTNKSAPLIKRWLGYEIYRSFACKLLWVNDILNVFFSCLVFFRERFIAK